MPYIASRFAHSGGALRRVHEDPLQLIQGGAPGEHFHLTQQEHETLTYDALFLTSLEPVMVVGELVLDEDGDVVQAVRIHDRSLL